jgi:uncharacterized membrane protein YbaN (DUF454 family)
MSLIDEARKRLANRPLLGPLIQQQNQQQAVQQEAKPKTRARAL